MEHQKIFATNIFLLDNFIDNTDTMKKYIGDLWKERDYDTNWQTKSANLQTKKEFKSFSDLVLATGKIICNNLGYDVKDLVITDMWANVLKQNEHHPAHTHSNNFLSGVYYLHTSKNSSPIQFFDPRAQAHVLQPRNTPNFLNSSMLQYDAIEGTGLIFPSWLQHEVQTNNSNDDRVIISFNINWRNENADS